MLRRYSLQIASDSLRSGLDIVSDIVKVRVRSCAGPCTGVPNHFIHAAESGRNRLHQHIQVLIAMDRVGVRVGVRDRIGVSVSVRVRVRVTAVRVRSSWHVNHNSACGPFARVITRLVRELHTSKVWHGRLQLDSE